MMNITKFSALASLAVLTTGVLAGAKPAKALVITSGSTLNISGNVSLTGIGVDDPRNGEPLTTLDFLNFDDPQPDFPGTGQFVIIDGTGSFAQFDPLPFQTGIIKDLPTRLDFDPNDSIDVGNAFNPLEDFLQFSEPDLLVNFDLETLGAPIYVESEGSTSVTIGATGNFDSDESTDVPGEVIFAAEFVGLTANQVRNIFRAGGTLENESNSGNLIVRETVPEPSSVVSLVTLGLIGTGFLAGKKKQNKIG